MIKELVPSFSRFNHIVESFTNAVKKRRITRIQAVITEMTKRGSTLYFSQRKGSAYNFSTTGEEIQVWLEKALGFSGKTEAAGFLRIMQKHGFLISTDFFRGFTPDGLYTIQAPTLWPNESWRPIEEDYLCYLLRRANGSKAVSFPLAPYEEERLAYFLREYEDTDKWEYLMERAVKQDELLQNLGAKAIQFKVQEFGFWDFYCPHVERIDISFASMSSRLEDSIRNRDALKNATQHENFTHLTRMISQYRISLRSEQLTIGEASSKLVDYSDLMQGIDPLVNTEGVDNVWHKTIWRTIQQPTIAHVRIWVNEFKLLLQDPLGFALFYDFDKGTTRNYGEFKRKTLQLSELAPARLRIAAFEIYQEFIRKGSPKELTFPLELRANLDLLFCSSQDIMHDCFDKVIAHFTESSNETLNLWRRMRDLKGILVDSNFQQEALSIYQNIKLVSQRKINLPANINRTISDIFEQRGRVPVDCFDRVEEYLFESMRGDYDAFCKSKYLSDLFIKIKENRDFRIGKFDSPLSLKRPTYYRAGPVQSNFTAMVGEKEDTLQAPKTNRRSSFFKELSLSKGLIECPLTNVARSSPFRRFSLQ